MYSCNDLVIRKDESGKKELDTYARVLFVSKERNVIALDRYMNFGRIPLGDTYLELPLNEVTSTGCYAHMNEDEMQKFYEGLTAVSSRKSNFAETKTIVLKAIGEKSS